MCAGGVKRWKKCPVVTFFGCFQRGPPRFGLFFVPFSYPGVGGPEFSDARGTQKNTIFGVKKNANYHSVGVDIIPGGGVGGDDGQSFTSVL